MTRGAVDQWTRENPRSMQLWHEFDSGMNQVEDREILRFLPELKRRLEAKGTMSGLRYLTRPEKSSLRPHSHRSRCGHRRCSENTT